MRRYLASKLDEELPPRGSPPRDAYRLLGLVHDTLDLKPLLVALYQEQVAGFYDPDSSTLFVLEGSDVGSPQFRFVLAHEMVHALQSNYLPLDSIMHQRWNNDRLAAAQAVLEGQATLASMQMMAPGQDMLRRRRDLGDVPRAADGGARLDDGVRAGAPDPAGGR